MGLKVVLTCLPFLNHCFTPPLPLGYLKAYLQQDEDITVKIIDAEVMYFHSPIMGGDVNSYMDLIRKGGSFSVEESRQQLDAVVDAIVSEAPDLVGFSVVHANFEFTHYVARQLKKIRPGIYIVFGGLRYCLKRGWRHVFSGQLNGLPDVDCFVKGEGEATLMHLAQDLKRGKKPEFCSGAILRVNGEIIDCGDRPLIEDIDGIPYPNFSDLPKDQYLSDYCRILFFRGCVGRCVYCSENYTMGTFRSRSPENIMGEIRLRMDQGYRRLQTADLALNSNMVCLRQVCASIIEEKLDLEFIFGQFRHSTNLTRETLALLRKAGFKVISFGTETGSQRILDRMRKGVNVETIEQNLRDAFEEGLQVVIFLMVGFPGETEETFQETLDFLKRNARYIGAVQHVAPVCIHWGSGFHENLDHYELDEETLFQLPDIWQTRDKKNTCVWRESLAERVHHQLRESDISYVTFEADGNPRIIEYC